MTDIITDLTEQFGAEKMKVPVFIAMCVSCFIEFANPIATKYLFQDVEFAIFLACLVALDTFTGVWKAFKLKKISSKGFGSVITKVLVYGIFAIVLHALEAFSDKEMVKIAFDWIGTFGYAAMMVREAISVIENLGAIQADLIPSWILKKLKDFDDDGKFNDPA
jgi:phage-related holin